MPDDNPFFYQAVQSPNFFAGQPINYSSSFNIGNGIPGMSGPTGMLMQLMLQPFIQQFAGANGFVPLQFAPTQGAYDHLMSNMFYRERMQAMQIAAGADQSTYRNLLRGVAHLTGTPYGPAQQAAASSMARDLSAITPFIANIAPNFLDNASGARGSAAVMANFMTMGMRFGRDPVTGLTGFGGENAGLVTRRVFENMFGDNLSLAEVAGRTRGLSAGRVGQMFDELQRRGLMGGGITDEDRQSVAAQVAAMQVGAPGLAPGQTMMDERLRNLQADRFSERLRNLAGAVSAMRDIFGDMGRQDAPMVEIINGLQALTQGGLATMDPSRLENTVRNIHLLVKNSGMTMDSMVQLMAAGARTSDQLGLNRQFVVNSAQGAAAFSMGHSLVGGGEFATFGALDRERITATDQQLRLNAANSFQADLLNSVLALDAQGMFRAGSEGARLAANIRSGNVSGPMSMQDYIRISTASGVNEATAIQSVGNRAMNQEFGSRADTAGLVRRFQTQEIQSLLTGVFADTSLNRLDAGTRAGIGNAGMNVLQESLGSAIFEISNEDFATPERRMDATIQRMLQSLTPAQRAALGPDPETALRPIVMSYFGNVEQAIRTNPNLAHFQSMAGMRQLLNPRTHAAAAQFRRETAINARVQAVLAPFNQTDLMGRTVQSILDAGPNADIGTLLRDLVNGVQINGQDATSLQGALRPLFEAQVGGTDFQSALEAFRRDPSQANQAVLERHLDRLIPGINNAFRDAGLTPGAPFNATVDRNVRNAFSAFETSMGGANNFTERARNARRALAQASGVINTALTDDDARSVLTSGDMRSIREIAEIRRQLQDAAGGGDVADVLAGGSGTADQQRQARELFNRLRDRIQGFRPGNRTINDPSIPGSRREILNRHRSLIESDLNDPAAGAAGGGPVASVRVEGTTVVRLDPQQLQTFREFFNGPNNNAANQVVSLELRNAEIRLTGPDSGTITGTGTAQIRNRGTVPAPAQNT